MEERLEDLIDAADALGRVGAKVAFLQTSLGVSREHGTSALTLNGDEQAGVFWIFQDLTGDISQIEKALNKSIEEKRQKETNLKVAK
jgi:hypothetical protein